MRRGSAAHASLLHVASESDAHSKFTHDLDRKTLRQLGNADCGPCVLAYLGPERLVKKIGSAVDDDGLALEVRRGIDHTEDPQYTSHLVEIADDIFDRADHQERNGARCRIAFLLRHLGSNFAALSDTRQIG